MAKRKQEIYDNYFKGLVKLLRQADKNNNSKQIPKDYYFNNGTKIITEAVNYIVELESSLNICLVEKDQLKLRNEIFEEKEEALKNVSKNGMYLKYLPSRLKADKDVVMAAVKQNGAALYFASDELKNNKEIVLEAVKQNGWALEYVSENLKDDKEIVMTAVEKYGSALLYASDRLKDDKEVVLRAVKDYGAVFKFASDRLKDDPEVALEAAIKDKKALKFVSKNLQKDPVFRGKLAQSIKVDINAWQPYKRPESLLNKNEIGK